MYREFKHLNLPAIDAEVRQFWENEKIFEHSVNQRPKNNAFVFFEGPPSANGKPGIHHVMARTVKDLFCRYNTLKGFRVERKGGWDTHGLPIELQVEKELGITKEDIGKKVTVEEYNAACRQTVMRYKNLWDDLTIRMGYWADLDNPYITFENEYIETVWYLLQRLYNKKTADGLSFLYKGFTIQPFSPAAGTGLSTHELNMPGTYKEVTDISAVAMFKLKHDEASASLFDSADEDVRILAWTTTPWTLPSNVALTVGPNIDYVKIKTLSPYTGAPVSIVLAKARVSGYFNAADENQPLGDFKVGDKKLPYTIAKDGIKGKDLVGVRYQQLLPTPAASTPELEANAFRVIPGDWVTTEDGTGVVHTAPYFGADDFRASKAAGIPFIGLPNDKNADLPWPLVDRQGKFVEEVPEFGGRYVKAEYYSKEEQADKDFKPTDLLIALRLKEDNKAFKIEKYKHNYPHCWRTDKPVLYYPLDSWFVRASAAKERLAELNRTINWQPESTGTGRFGQWLDNLQDWNLSRSRYWGIPLPIWRTDDGEEEICIGSVMELNAEIEKSVKAGFMKSNPYKGVLTDDEPTLEKYVFTGDKKFWDILKSYGRDNRKNPTEAEDLLWQALRNRQLDNYKFRRQHQIGTFIADFACIPAKLVIEVDGEYHGTPEQVEFDQARTAYLNNVGFSVIRFTNQEVMKNLNEVLDKIREFLASPPNPLSIGEGEYSVTPGSSPSPMERGLGGEADLHRPFIDEVVLVSPSGRPMRRETDLIDVWFDSGAMPYAQWGLDYEKLKNGDEKPFKAPFDVSYPATFIAEGVDQTRGWFYTLHAIAGMVYDSVAFKNVVSNGLVLDKNGEKMSKSKGNVVDPFDTLSEFGADATRWYMMSNANPWDNLKFDTSGILEVRNKLFGTMYNTYNFFALYANLDGFKHDEFNVFPYEKRSELDRWVISKLYSLVAEYRAAMDDYDVTKACRAIEDFVDEHLSNWYVRLSRRRFWKASPPSPLSIREGEHNSAPISSPSLMERGLGGEVDKQAAYQTLFECLMVTTQLMASVAPFFADWMYRNLTDPIRGAAKANNSPLRHDSVHLTDLVQPDASKVDQDLEKRMDYAQRICSLALSIRKKEKLRVRQPLQKVLLPVLDEAFIAEVDGVKALILSEINVKELEYVTDASGLLKKGAKANFKTLGAKLGKDMKDAAAMIAGLTNEQINDLEKTGSLAVTLNGNNYSITPEDLVITTEDLPGWKVASEGALTVALDVTLNDALVAEGTARDLVNRIQNLRKDKDFNVTDRIAVRIERHAAIEAAVAQFGAYIQEEVLANSLSLADQVSGETVELNDEVSLVMEVSVV
ncbi:MAG: class I tRNA ligase family protein [Chitinophagales bacterium]|nr:class I tRNA ligase family protein [Chitinophagales bacterium]